MKPRIDSDFYQPDLFRSQLIQILNPDHPLILLSDKIDWKRFETVLGDCFCSDNGAPALPIRLMIGLLYLKHAFNESDESLVQRWIENPYWQYFCGFNTLQHELPLHPTSLVKWRQRVGAERLAELLRETIDLAVKEKQISPGELQQVNIDTTVQEKNIAFPTDSNLLHKAIRMLVKAARGKGIRLRQTYARVAKRTAIGVGRYAHAKQFRRMHRGIRKLKTWLGRLLREIWRNQPNPDQDLKRILELCARLHKQQPKDSCKLYSLHECEVACIGKGKAHKRYEFGQKVALATSNRGNWIVGIHLCPGNPYDGHTLTATLRNIESITGREVNSAYVDKGYRGHGYEGNAVIHIAGKSRGDLTGAERKRKKRRSAIEPKIGHMKSENRMGRCYLRGLAGDAMNAVLAAAGSNLRKLLRGLFFVFGLVRQEIVFVLLGKLGAQPVVGFRA